MSETARKLFVHRNTLVYRLEKIKKLTGLDLREFDDAITFKVALMVKKYLVSPRHRELSNHPNTATTISERSVNFDSSERHSQGVPMPTGPRP